MTDLPRPVVAIPLKDAALCLSCEAVFYLAGSSRCPMCDDEHFQMVEAITGTAWQEKFDARVGNIVRRSAGA